VVRSSVSHGRKHGFATALGVNTGALVWGAGAAVGISALLEASTVGYTTVRIAGALYMLWLGSRLLLKAVRDRGDDRPLPDAAPAAPRGLARSWSTGLFGLRLGLSSK
jgi:threonine/homoserine/homoserine lactone efflux protein